jgi:hypothetical protein
MRPFLTGCAALLFTTAAVIALLSLSILASADARAEGATGISFQGFLITLGLVFVGWRLVAWRPTVRVEPLVQPAGEQPSAEVDKEVAADV